MVAKTDMDILDGILTRYQVKKEVASKIVQAFARIYAIDEDKTFTYTSLEEFEKNIPLLNELKEDATKSFRPFADKCGTSLCAAMGVPMIESIIQSTKTGNYEIFHEVFGLVNAKAKRFGLAALYLAMQGQKNKAPNQYNIVFDRDSPWTYRNEAEHMEEYARYHFNSYMINQVENSESNPFEPVMELYEHGAADFIFMQTAQEDITEERLATFHTVNIPGKGNVIGVHMTGDEKLFYFRRWGEPYNTINPVNGHTKLKVIGIADQRFRAD